VRTLLDAAALVFALGVFLPPQTTIAAGVYVDAAGDVVFLTAPQAKALTGRLIRSNGNDVDASLYVLNAAFTVKSYALVELDIPFVTIAEPSDVNTGLGDLVLRARARLYSKPGRIVHLISAFRTGSGTTNVYPFASQSLDLELGVGYVDSLQLFHLWATAGGAYVTREPENVPDEELHGSYARFSAGIRFPFDNGFGVVLGMTALVYGESRDREIYIAAVDYRRSQWLTFTLSAHAEGGDREERVGDTALTAGFRVYY
jgi:hypothetical protein